MIHIHRTGRIIALLVLILLSVTPLNATPAKIGVILPFTGISSQLANSMKTACQLALEMDDSEPFQLIFADNHNRPDSSRAVAEMFANDPNVIAIMGGFPDSCCREVIQIANKHSLPHLIIASSSDNLTDSSSSYLFRLAPPFSSYNDGLISMLSKAIGVERTLTFLYEDDDRSNKVMSGWDRDLAHLWRGRIDYQSFFPGQKFFNPIIEKLDQGQTSALIIVCQTNDAVRFLNQCKEDKWIPPLFVLGAVALANDTLISQADGAIDYACAPAIWHPELSYTRVPEFRQQFQQKLEREPDHYAAFAFAAVEVMIDAFERTESHTRSGIRDALKTTNLATVVGPVKFESYRGFNRQNKVQSVAIQFLDGRWRVVWRNFMAETDYVYPIPDWRDTVRTTPKKPARFAWIWVGVIAIALFVLIRKKY